MGTQLQVIISSESGSGYGSGSRGLMTKPEEKKYRWKFFSLFFIKNYPRPHKERPSYRRRLQPSKENTQHFKKWNLLTLFYVCGSFLPSRIRIRIQGPHWIRTRIHKTAVRWYRTWNWRKHRWIFVPQYLGKAAGQLDGQPVSPHHRVQIIWQKRWIKMSTVVQSTSRPQLLCQFFWYRKPKTKNSFTKAIVRKHVRTPVGKSLWNVIIVIFEISKQTTLNEAFFVTYFNWTQPKTKAAGGLCTTTFKNFKFQLQARTRSFWSFDGSPEISCSHRKNGFGFSA